MKAQIPHNRLTYGLEEAAAVAAVVRSGQWTGGAAVQELESDLGRRLGRSVATVGSGLGALRLALKALGIRPGDEVIVPAYSCVALANAPLALGATPVSADISPGDWNVAPEAVERAMSRRTRAIVAVDTFGAPADVRTLGRFGVPVVEDCAHSIGARAKDGIMGSRSAQAITSFHATKLLGAGEGGAVICRDPEIAERARDLRGYADRPADGTRLNDEMSDLEAALASAQLVRLDAMLERRELLAQRYRRALESSSSETGAFILPTSNAGRAWYRYAVEVLGPGAVALRDRMRAAGIWAEKPVVDWRRDGRDQASVADGAYLRLLSLPLFPTLTESEQDRVVEVFLSSLR